MSAPLSPGSPEGNPTAASAGPTGSGRCRLVRGPIDGAAALAAVSEADAGGNVLFLGSTRGVTAGVTTLGLDYEAHEPLALAMLEDLRSAAMERFSLRGCVIVHRLGRVAVGEASIAIAASAPHRKEAFAAAEWLLERVKAEVPIWKCEEDGAGVRNWLHPGDMRAGVGEER
jgi:molybdopterin synthase catalytic subunit